MKLTLTVDTGALLRVLAEISIAADSCPTLRGAIADLVESGLDIATIQPAKTNHSDEAAFVLTPAAAVAAVLKASRNTPGLFQ